MKSLRLIIAALLVLPVFFSCGGNHEPEPKPTPTTPTTPTTPSTPENPPVTPPDNPPVTPPAPPIEFRNTFRFDKNIISTNGSGDFVAVFNESLTKGGDGRKIVTGSYTFDNDSKTWNYTGFGKIVLGDDNKISFSTADGVSKTFVAEISEISSDEESVAYKLNGCWTTKQTVVEFRGGTYRYQGDLDLNEVEKQARDLGYEFTTHLEDGMVVSKIIVTDSMMAAEFKNGQSYAAEHNLRIGSTFKFSEFTKGLDGTGAVEFGDGTCVITINTVVDESPVTLYLTLQKKQ